MRQEYKIHNAEVLFREDATVDDLIDVIEGNRRYIRCLYVYNKVDVCSIEEVDTIARLPNSVPASAGMRLNMDGLLASIWSKMALVRVYTKRVRAPPCDSGIEVQRTLTRQCVCVGRCGWDGVRRGRGRGVGTQPQRCICGQASRYMICRRRKGWGRETETEESLHERERGRERWQAGYG